MDHWIINAAANTKAASVSGAWCAQAQVTACNSEQLAEQLSLDAPGTYACAGDAYPKT